jgi:hypothetical protein
MELTDEILLAILAATDAVFVPDRDPRDFRRHTVLYERRRDYPNAGVPWASEKVLPGLDEAGRKRAQRALEELVAQGMVEARRPKGAKTHGVKLTDAGEARARALCGLPLYEGTQAMVEQLSRLVDDGSTCAYMGKLWTPEPMLAGVQWGDNARRKKFVEVEERLLPALSRGQVVSNCSIQGHCWYSVHPKPTPMPPVPAGLPTSTDDHRAEYYVRIHQELADLRLAEPLNPREIGEIPMPVCPLPAHPVAQTPRGQA